MKSYSMKAFAVLIPSLHRAKASQPYWLIVSNDDTPDRTCTMTRRTARL